MAEKKEMFSRKTVQAAKKIVADELTGLVLAETIQRIGIPAEHDVILKGVKETAERFRDNTTKELQATQKPLPQILEDFERAIIDSVLKRTGTDLAAAARTLGISQRSLVYKIDKYQLSTEDKQG